MHPHLSNDSVAQLVEQRPFKPWALGSNPSGITDECQNPISMANRIFYLAQNESSLEVLGSSKKSKRAERVDLAFSKWSLLGILYIPAGSQKHRCGGIAFRRKLLIRIYVPASRSAFHAYNKF